MNHLFETILLFALGIVYVAVFVFGCISFVRNKRELQKGGFMGINVRPRRLIGVLGVLSIPLALETYLLPIVSMRGKGLEAYMAVVSDIFGFWLVTAVGAVIFGMLLVMRINFRIEGFDTYLIFTNALGKKQRYDYNRITFIDYGRYTLYHIDGKSTFKVSKKSANGALLQETIAKYNESMKNNNPDSSIRF